MVTRRSPRSLSRRRIAGAARAYFAQADWLWNTIPASPVLDPQSASISAALATGLHVANLYDYGVALVPTSKVTGATPRFDIAFANVPAWGPDPFGTDTCPIPTGTRLGLLSVPNGGDVHYTALDPTTNKVYSVWQANFSGTTKTGSYGGSGPLNGDGLDTLGAAVGCGFSRYAGVIAEAEIAAGVIPHALFFSTNMARATTFRFPANRTDGSNLSGSATTIMEGTRVQLDPSINVNAIPGITAGEATVARALQQYGAYCGDNGGSRMAFLFEIPQTGTVGSSTVYNNAGLGWDYFDMTNIPWGSLRVLNSWNGT
jgi:hypothetical protein